MCKWRTKCYYDFQTEGDERENLRLCLQHINVISAVVCSTKKPTKMEEFRQYCNQAYAHQLRSFPFQPINKSIHRICGHCCDKMEQLDAGMAQISENCLEHQVCF